MAESLHFSAECGAIRRLKLNARHASASAKFGWCAVRHNLAAVDNADAIGDFNLIQIMSSEDHRRLLAAPDRIKISSNRAARLRVKANCRLVKEEHLRPMEERSRNLQLAAHAA